MARAGPSASPVPPIRGLSSIWDPARWTSPCSIRGGKRRVMEELAPLAIEYEPRLQHAVVRWAQLTPWQRRFVTLDDLAAHAGLAPGEFLGAIARASFEFTSSISDLIVGTALPEIVVASVKRALTPDGLEIGLLLLQHMGFFDNAQGAVSPDSASAANNTNGGPTRDLPPTAA